MKTKYKIGDRILHITADGTQLLANVTAIHIEITPDSCTVSYRDNDSVIEESKILGQIVIKKTHTRNRRKKLRPHTSDAASQTVMNGIA